MEKNKNLTDTFFYIALTISLFFSACFLLLFICYMVIYHKVNRYFKAVNND